MYKNILVPIVFDHEPTADDALAIASALLENGGKITLFHVVEEIPSHILVQLPEGLMKRSLKDALTGLKKISAQSDLEITTVAMLGHASRTILEYASEIDSDCIVISSHHPGLGDYFLGSTASRVVRHARCAVHILR